MSTIVESLTRDIVNRDLSAEGAALLNKWEKTGLLEGLDNERTKNGMAVLLENQAKELLREASSMSAGDVEGFAAVAFPIVRRVFGGLIANELVSVQPMSLPSGLIFFLDFTFNASRLEVRGNLPSNSKDAFVADKSVYGGDKVGKEIAQGVNISGLNVEAGPYGLNTGYASPESASLDNQAFSQTTATELQGGQTVTQVRAAVNNGSITTEAERNVAALIAADPDLTATDNVAVVKLSIPDDLNRDILTGIVAGSASVENAFQAGGLLATSAQARRLTQIDGSDLYLVFTAGSAMTTNAANKDQVNLAYILKDAVSTSGLAAGALELDLFLEGAGDGTSFTNTGLSGQNTSIPEIDIKVDSIAVTATTKKLKAKWTPELAQDLNAYHNLDAEVELTSILSEQVALEIDQEILQDLINGATAGRKYWSRRPGKFVDRDTGAQVGATTAAPDFTGTVSEWYETLAETINDVSANIHRKTLRGGANFVVCSPEVANILEFTAGFRATVNHEELKGGSIGAVKVGAMSKKFDVYVDPYFPRAVVLVGRRGNSFLESGYVYAPYVPLQVTPTIFGVEDFVPRKGVMTRYAKKMVRPDMYGLVICQDLIG
jgi:hypothetical protein